MALPGYLLTGRAVDAIHAHLAYAMGRDATALGSRTTDGALVHGFDAAAMVKEIEERIEATPAYDACWIAALYAVLLAPNHIYQNTNAATAMVTVYAVLARAGFRLVTTDREFFPIIHAVSKESRSPGELHEGLAEWLRRRCVAKRHLP